MWGLGTLPDGNFLIITFFYNNQTYKIWNKKPQEIKNQPVKRPTKKFCVQFQVSLPLPMPPMPPVRAIHDIQASDCLIQQVTSHIQFTYLMSFRTFHRIFVNCIHIGIFVYWNYWMEISTIPSFLKTIQTPVLSVNPSNRPTPFSLIHSFIYAFHQVSFIASENPISILYYGTQPHPTPPLTPPPHHIHL